jgi:SAM-dependent methyltransferase
MMEKSVAIQQFAEVIQQSIASATFVKCTLAKPRNNAEGLRNIYAKLVEIKQTTRLALTYHFATRDEIQHFDLAAGIQELCEALSHTFQNADFFDQNTTFSYKSNKNGAQLTQQKTVNTVINSEKTHNRQKVRLLDPAASYLQDLDISNAKGEILPTGQKKYKQINKYLETIDHLLNELPKNNPAPRIVDMGSGKGYLTFALYDFLTHQRALSPKITGIELRPALVDFCNNLSQKNDFSNGLDFQAQDIETFDAGEPLDWLIALHACDTATDLAIAKGVASQAQLIVVAPCCHKQIRKALTIHEKSVFQPVLQYGILAERQAEILTDTIRALLLQSQGYRTNVFQFVDTEHTPKNVMITAIRSATSAAKRAEALAQVTALKAQFGIAEHALEAMLG